MNDTLPLLAHGNVGMFLAIAGTILLFGISIGYTVLFSRWRKSVFSFILALISVCIGVVLWLDVSREADWLFSYYFFVSSGFIIVGCVRIVLSLTKNYRSEEGGV